jgi:hypothetical protein
MAVEDLKTLATPDKKTSARRSSKRPFLPLGLIPLLDQGIPTDRDIPSDNEDIHNATKKRLMAELGITDMSTIRGSFSDLPSENKQ